jgi:sugar lactone lactonase YvrE
MDGREARVVFATPHQMSIVVPADLDGGRVSVRIDDAPGASVLLEVGVPVATGIHQVDSPAIAPDGTLFVTCSGTRGQQTPVSVYRVHDTGLREMFVTGLTNATSMAFAPDGSLYVSSRFDGTVSRVDDQGRVEVVASDLGIACGIAFAPDGTMFVGDRTGTVFRIDPTGDAQTMATLPPSVAAYHLAADARGVLYVAGPTLAPRDDIYRIAPDGTVSVFVRGFGRPQGMAVDARGRLLVVEALAGAAGLYAVDEDGRVELLLAAPSLVGVAVASRGGLVVASNDTAWRFPGLPAT